MKFQCDRCKTRYSIAEERVRGKILKIRCKNCSAVITVREPRPDSVSGIEASAERAATAASSPRAKAGAGSALLGAFQDVIQRPVGDREPEPSASDSFRAPDHFEQEWYVSVDGVQSGPFSLEHAKEWVGAQNPDDELHCWNEDFDDWLPVEKVSHFRGIRRLPPPPGGPPSRAASPLPPRLGSTPPGPRAASPTGRPPGPEDTPRPLFGPTLAAIEAEQGRARLEKTPKPLFGPTLAAIEAEQGVPHSEKTPPPLFRPPSGADNRGFGGLDEPTEIAPAPVMAMMGAAAAAAPAEAVPGEIPSTESMPDDEDSDLDFEIGEPSRMVKLPMLATPPGGVAQPVASKGLPGVARLSKDGSGSQAAVPLSPLSETALAGSQPEILAAGGRRRPRLVIPLLIGGAVVIAAAVGVLIHYSGDSDETSLAKSRLYGDELSYRPDTSDQVRVITKEVIKDNPVIKWKTGNNTSNSGGDKTTNGTSNGTGASGPNLPADQIPLSPNDVINVSRENALGNRRCYENALKKDPFLDVKSIKVKLTVAPSGVVTNLVMSSHSDTVLGQCLQSRIRKWVFRKSPGGITTQLTLSFEQS